MVSHRHLPASSPLNVNCDTTTIKHRHHHHNHHARCRSFKRSASDFQEDNALIVKWSQNLHACVRCAHRSTPYGCSSNALGHQKHARVAFCVSYRAVCPAVQHSNTAGSITACTAQHPCVTLRNGHRASSFMCCVSHLKPSTRAAVSSPSTLSPGAAELRLGSEQRRHVRYPTCKLTWAPALITIATQSASHKSHDNCSTLPGSICSPAL